MNEVILFDKNIARTISHFEKQYGGDSALMRDVIMYLIEKRKISLFSEIIFDTTEFCKMFKYCRANLFTNNPDALHIKHLNKSKEYGKYEEEAKTNNVYHIYNSYLDNVLYMLVNEPYRFPSNFSTKYYNIEDKSKQEYDVISLQAVQILRRVDFMTNKSAKGQTKHFYMCEFNGDFYNTLFKFFIQIDYKHTVLLRKPNMDMLYIKLEELKNTLQSQDIYSIEKTFDDICDWCAISTDGSMTQRERKKKINTKFKTFEALTQMGVRIEWKKRDNEKWYYRPVLHFSATSIKSHNVSSEYMLSEFLDLSLRYLKTIKSITLGVFSNLSIDQGYLGLCKYIANGSISAPILQSLWMQARNKIYLTPHPMSGGNANIASSKLATIGERLSEVKDLDTLKKIVING